MFIPIKTDEQLKQTPLMNYFLIAACVVIFFVTYAPVEVRYGYKTFIDPLKPWADVFVLHSDQPKIWQYVTYAFLHSSHMHIIGNMFFLYLFGNKINDRLGNIGYLCFYISGAIFAGLGYSFFHDSPVLGASGAVAAVTGAYLVLYPKSLITIMYWLIFIGTIEVPAFWFILVKMVLLDNIIPARYMNSKVAYDAHLSGYTFGVVVILFLLSTKMLKSDGIDFLYMIRQWNRRRAYRDTLRKFEKSPHSRILTPQEAISTKKNISETDLTRIITKRNLVSQYITAGDLDKASAEYIEIMRIDDSQTMPRQQQLDIANHLMSRGEAQDAANAYVLFKEKYPKYNYIEQIDLMLGILYSRYLNKPQKAIDHLNAALERLSDKGQIEMCENEIKKALKRI